MSTKWKQPLAWTLTLCLMLSLCACGGIKDANSTNDPAQGNHVTEEHIQNSTTEAPTEESVKVPLEQVDPNREYPNNILMTDMGKYIGDSVLGNSAITRAKIQTVTFLDTLSGAPASAWDCSENQDGSVMAWLKNEGDLYIAGEGGVTASSCSRLFNCYINVTRISFNDCFYTDITTGMAWMFGDCRKLEELDLSFFNTSNVTSIFCMFYGCANLQYVELSNWDTHMITDFGGAFSFCAKLTELDVSGWDTSSAGSTARMFMRCESLAGINLSGWDTSNVHDMIFMFSGCEKLTDIGCALTIPEGCSTTDMYKNSGLE